MSQADFASSFNVMGFILALALILYYMFFLWVVHGHIAKVRQPDIEKTIKL